MRTKTLQSGYHYPGETMACTYFDRGGNEITAQEWLRLSGDPRYTTVKITPTPHGNVETSWCGLIHSRERKPALFVVRVKSEKGAPDPLTAWQWYLTEDAALVAHERMVEALVARPFDQPKEKI